MADQQITVPWFSIQDAAQIICELRHHRSFEKFHEIIQSEIKSIHKDVSQAFQGNDEDENYDAIIKVSNIASQISLKYPRLFDYNKFKKNGSIKVSLKLWQYFIKLNSWYKNSTDMNVDKKEEICSAIDDCLLYLEDDTQDELLKSIEFCVIDTQMYLRNLRAENRLKFQLTRFLRNVRGNPQFNLCKKRLRTEFADFDIDVKRRKYC